MHGLPFSRTHDAAKNIHKLTQRMEELPILMDMEVWDQLSEWISRKSEYFAELHHKTIYGYQDSGIPASKLFTIGELDEITTEVAALYAFSSGPLLIIGNELNLLSEARARFIF
jgi:hypothetical protein